MNKFLIPLKVKYIILINHNWKLLLTSNGSPFVHIMEWKSAALIIGTHDKCFELNFTRWILFNLGKNYHAVIGGEGSLQNRISNYVHWAVIVIAEKCKHANVKLNVDKCSRK